MSASENNNCKDGASKLDYDGVCEMNDMLQNVSTAGDEYNVSICANCGKEGSSNEISNMCNKCQSVKYCNAACKKKHRHKHEKECKRRVAELHDQELFKQPPSQYGDCPICFLILPYIDSGRKYMACCGKEICTGCCFAPVYDNQGKKVKSKKCPFCRTLYPTSYEEGIERMTKRVELNDPIAIHNIGTCHILGSNGFPQDYTKALKLYHRAAELGNAEAYNSIGYAYDYGEGVDQDEKKATHFYELAAMRGNVEGRHNLGNEEKNEGIVERALKHYIEVGMINHYRKFKTYTQMAVQLKKITRKLCKLIKHTWMKLRAYRGMKLLRLVSIIVTISSNAKEDHYHY